MSSDLERRLRGALARPRSGADAEERALAAALAALAPPQRSRRPRTLALAAAVALAVATVAAAGALAAGTLHVSLGGPAREPVARSFPPRLLVPHGLHGIAAVVDGRLWLATAQDVRIEGLRVTTAELSPRALYVAAGIGRTLVAMAPDGRRAWAHPAGGTVAAIAWAPSGLEIAYVVRRGGRFELRRIEGDGDHDRLVDRSVRPVRPSWRADSLAFAYVGAGGHAVIRDYARGSRSVVPAPAPATAVAFAPAGARLAVASRRRVQTWAGVRSTRAAATAGRVAGLAWTSRGLAVAVEPAVGPSFVRWPDGRVPVGPGGILALAAAGSRALVAVGTGGGPLRVLTSEDGGRASPRLDRSLLVLRGGGRVDVLVAR